jgi:hypothetical protein
MFRRFSDDRQSTLFRSFMLFLEDIIEISCYLMYDDFNFLNVYLKRKSHALIATRETKIRTWKRRSRHSFRSPR